MKMIDCHCDTLMALNDARLAGTEKTFERNDLHVDLEKLEKGDYLLQCFAAFVNFAESPVSPLLEVIQEIDVFHQLMALYPDRIAPAYRFADIERNRQSGKISGLLTIEDLGCCFGDLAALRTLHRLGARMMTLTWNYENSLGFPNNPVLADPGIDYPGSGLKPAGIAFVEEMDRLGIIIDVSHLSDAGFFDVAAHSQRPFIASHSNARSLCSHPRNLTDEMLRVLADRGGFVGMNYCLAFLDDDQERLKARGTAEAVVDHIEHIRKVAGLDIVGLGSDFDGIDVTMQLKDASTMGLLVETMERRGFTTTEIEKVCHQNALRVFKELL